MMWLGGCTMINVMTTEEVSNPYTGQTVRVQKRYLTWEKGVSSGILMGLIGTTSALLKEM
jgi:hypothetical protein